MMIINFEGKKFIETMICEKLNLYLQVKKHLHLVILQEDDENLICLRHNLKSLTNFFML
jgi:hypothetical protein